MCQRRRQRCVALLRIIPPLAEGLQIRTSLGHARKEAFPQQKKCAHIFQARSLQVAWPRCSKTGSRTLSKRKHFLDLKRETRSLNTRNVQSRRYRGNHSKILTPRRQTLRNNSGTNPSPDTASAQNGSHRPAIIRQHLPSVSIRIRSSANGDGDQIDSVDEPGLPTA